MDELLKFLPLISFIGTVCTAITAAMLLKAQTSRLSIVVDKLSNLVTEIDKRLNLVEYKLEGILKDDYNREPNSRDHE